MTYVSSSRSGQSDALAASSTCPVPAGAASGMMAVLAVEIYVGDAGSTLLASNAFTWPSGFTQWGMIGTQNHAQIFIATKTLTGADSGNYVPTWTGGSRWNQSQCVLASGVVAAVPQDANNAKTGASNPISSVSASPDAATTLVYIQANANSATHTPPTGFTERQEADYMAVATLDDSAGTYSTSGAAQSTNTGWANALVALKAASSGNPISAVYVGSTAASLYLGSTQVL